MIITAGDANSVINKQKNMISLSVRAVRVTVNSCQVWRGNIPGGRVHSVGFSLEVAPNNWNQSAPVGLK